MITYLNSDGITVVLCDVHAEERVVIENEDLMPLDENESGEGDLCVDCELELIYEEGAGV